mmetsp:Transcript_828/g.2572  ORF Transcript_828/g.2572 Transcript_828/m.2572 type:complete len:247 (-) Transcript_828:98-838(-)
MAARASRPTRQSARRGLTAPCCITGMPAGPTRGRSARATCSSSTWAASTRVMRRTSPTPSQRPAASRPTSASCTRPCSPRSSRSSARCGRASSGRACIVSPSGRCSPSSRPPGSWPATWTRCSSMTLARSLCRTGSAISSASTRTTSAGTCPVTRRARTDPACAVCGPRARSRRAWSSPSSPASTSSTRCSTRRSPSRRARASSCASSSRASVARAACASRMACSSRRTERSASPRARAQLTRSRR